MTQPNHSSRFDEVDLTTLSIVALEAYFADLRVRVQQTTDPYIERAYYLRIAEAHRELAIRNRRETERQEVMTVATAASQTAGAERLRDVVREAVLRFAPAAIDDSLADAIADRLAAQLTAPSPGHVCPVPYGLGPEDLDILEDIARKVVGATRTRAVLDKILAAHRAPEPAPSPPPEVIACGTEGCVSSIKKSYLPSGWLLVEGRWHCPRCRTAIGTATEPLS